MVQLSRNRKMHLRFRLESLENAVHCASETQTFAQMSEGLYKVAKTMTHLNHAAQSRCNSSRDRCNTRLLNKLEGQTRFIKASCLA